jgi:hypothetical protein
MDEGRSGALAIVAGILVAHHLKTADDLSTSPTRPMVAAAVQWAAQPPAAPTASAFGPGLVGGQEAVHAAHMPSRYGKEGKPLRVHN